MGETRDSIADIWGDRTPFEGAWPERVDERTTAKPERWVQSACVLCSNGCGLDIGVRGGKIVGVRGRAVDRVNRGRLGPKGLHGWEANAQPRPAHPAAGPARRASSEEATWDEAMGLIVDRSKEIIATASRPGRSASTRSGQLFLEEYYTLGVIGKAGLGTPHMDGNTRLCTATAAAALKETFGSDGQPGSYADLDTTEAILHVGHNVASQQTVLWSRILDRRRGPNPPKLVVIDPRRTDDGQGGRRPPRPAARDERRRCSTACCTSIIEAGQHRPRLHRGAHRRLRRSCARRSRRWPPGRVEEVTGVPAATAAGGGRDPRHGAESLVSTVLQGVYQSMQATAAAVPGEQPPPDPRHDRQAGLRHPPDERPADRAEHPRVRRRRRPARLPQLGQPRAHRRAGPALERRAVDRSPTGRRRRTRCRSSATPRRARSSCSGSAPPTRPSRMPELGRIRKILATRGPVRRRAGRLPDRDDRAGRRRPARGDLGREDRHASPTPTAPSTSRTRPSSRPARRGRTSTSSSTTPGGWTSATRTARPLIKWSDAGGGLRGLEGMHAAAGPATTRA